MNTPLLRKPQGVSKARKQEIARERKKHRMQEKENPIQEGGRGNPRMAGGQQLHSNSEWRGKWSNVCKEKILEPQDYLTGLRM